MTEELRTQIRKIILEACDATYLCSEENRCDLFPAVHPSGCHEDLATDAIMRLIPELKEIGKYSIYKDFHSEGSCEVSVYIPFGASFAIGPDDGRYLKEMHANCQPVFIINEKEK